MLMSTLGEVLLPPFLEHEYRPQFFAAVCTLTAMSGQDPADFGVFEESLFADECFAEEFVRYISEFIVEPFCNRYAEAFFGSADSSSRQIWCHRFLEQIFCL